MLTMSDVHSTKAKERHAQVPRKPLTMDDIRESLLSKYIKGLYKDGKMRVTTPLWEKIPSGHWKGRRCFVIGGGTSLKDFDFNKLKGELVITVNRSFESVPFSVINICQDARLWGWYETKELGEEARTKFYAYEGYKTWLNVQAFPFPEDIYQILPTHPDDFKWEKPTLQGGIPMYGNSGLNAITVALCLGANPIYLLGFDMYGKDGKTANFHSGYPDTNNEKVYKENFLPDFKELSWRIKSAKVINLNPNSAVRYFDFDTFDNLPKIKKPQLVSFYTKGTGYEVEKERLRITARNFGYVVDFYEQENKGSWRKNIHDRIRILRHFLNKYSDDILYIDCDAEMAQYPILFDNWDKGDLGIVKIDRQKYFGANWNHQWKEQYEYLGGTMYFKNNQRIRNLLDLWERLDIPMDKPLSQLTLFYALEELKKENKLDVFELPPNYTQIFDTMADCGEPIIEHFQASRRGLICIEKNAKGEHQLIKELNGKG